jgi:CHASE2 domain-containing sensor protein
LRKFREHSRTVIGQMSDKIRILFLAANSSESNRLYLEREVRAIGNSLHSGGDYRDSFELILKLAVRPQDLTEALLRHKPHVVHFSGHGTESDGMVLTDEFPDSRAVGAHALAALLKILKDEIKVVVFNACFAQEQATAVTEIIDFTIGMSGLIDEQARIDFSAAFYQALTFDRSVADAFDLAQNQLLLQQHESFQAPVLMTRAEAHSNGFVTSTLKQDDSTSALVEKVFDSHSELVRPSVVPLPAGPQTDRRSLSHSADRRDSRILRDFLKGLLFITLILAAKVAFEHTEPGRQLELAGYVYLQRHLAADDVPVQILDISDLGVTEIHSNGRVYRATSRDALQKLIQAIVDQGPRAIGIDIDFSPDANGYLTPDDPEFFQFCLDSDVPILLGVYRTQVLPPEAWLGEQRFEPLGASIIIPNEDTRKLPLTIRTSPQFEPGRAMGAALGNVFGEARCRIGEFLQQTGVAQRQWNTELGVGGEIVEFPVDYSALDELKRNKTLRTTSPDLVREQGSRFHNKIVLIGRAATGEAKDTFFVAGQTQPISGVYIHASAAYTIAKAPLYELKWKSRLVIDAIMSGGILLVVIGIRLRFRKSASVRISTSKVQTLLTVIVVGVAIITGVVLVRVTCVLWTDFILALGAVVLHPAIEHRLSNLWEFTKRTVPGFLRRLISENDEEVRK